MMAEAQQSPKVLSEIEAALAREILFAGGRRDGLQFASNHKNDLAAISAEIQEMEARISDPRALAGPMKPNAHPRIYTDAYLTGLKDAVELIEQFRAQVAPRV
jgi:hypothetical protein